MQPSSHLAQGLAVTREAGGGLPCQDSHNSIGSDLVPLQTLKDVLKGPGAKRLFSVRENVKALVETAGFNRVGFLTLTFKGGCRDIKEAQRRFNSFATNCLRHRFGQWACVVERHKKGGVHFHLVVDTKRDIRTHANGSPCLDFDGLKRRNYTSANTALRGLWRELRDAALRYGFGERSIELLPIKVSANAVGAYVGKYLGKHLCNRKATDRKKKLVRYSKGANRYRQQISWASPGAESWRCKLGHVVKACGGTATAWGMKEQLGARWAFKMKPLLIAARLYEEPGRKPEMAHDEQNALFVAVNDLRLKEQKIKERKAQSPTGWRQSAVRAATMKHLETWGEVTLTKALRNPWCEGSQVTFYSAELPDEWIDAVVVNVEESSFNDQDIVYRITCKPICKTSRSHN